LTAPLITKADGTKFVMTESGAVWLTADRTSPYAFYQFWLGTLDGDVIRYLKTFTLMLREQIEELTTEHDKNPGGRAAHRALAGHVTELLHGKEAREQAEAASRALFSGDVRGLPETTLGEVFASAPLTEHRFSELDGEGASLADLLVSTKIAKSKREAREYLSTGAVSVNGERMDVEARLTKEQLLYGKIALIRRGKKTWHVARFA